MSKISNPAGAVRVLRSTMAKMAADYKALERKLARVTAIKDREFDARVMLEAEKEFMVAAIKDAVHACVGVMPTAERRAHEWGALLLEAVRGAMKIIEQNNVEGAEQRDRIRELETAESSRMLTLAEDNAIVNALSESRLGDMPVVEAIASALRAEALEPIVVSTVGEVQRYVERVLFPAPHPMRYAREVSL